MLVVINLQRCIRQQCAVSCELVVEEEDQKPILKTECITLRVNSPP